MLYILSMPLVSNCSTFPCCISFICVTLIFVMQHNWQMQIQNQLSKAIYLSNCISTWVVLGWNLYQLLLNIKYKTWYESSVFGFYRIFSNIFASNIFDANKSWNIVLLKISCLFFLSSLKIQRIFKKREKYSQQKTSNSQTMQS